MAKFKFLFTFPELKAAYAQQEAIGEGSDFSVALSRAAKEVMKRKGVKGSRFTSFRLAGSKIENGVESSSEDE